MAAAGLQDLVPERIAEVMQKQGITRLMPAQEKAVRAGLFSGKNLLVCTPTASGKTLVAEMAMLDTFFSGEGMSVYIVPLKALASEKHKQFTEKYGGIARIALSIGDIDSSESRLSRYDIVITTSEKLDSLIRHKTPWLSSVRTMVVDEIHLLNDPARGPTLEILITVLRKVIPRLRIVGLSATIGNPKELADWLGAELVVDSWRPIPLHKGVYHDGKIEFH
ncbi:DEAD/DEAH box helicase [Candidatus Woesearchaeota archaeon]|nr:DEAD/DEAH box helicase [Candidatus Woesearchaeota archaeon]